jgi:hypothetical protein
MQNRRKRRTQQNVRKTKDEPRYLERHDGVV